MRFTKQLSTRRYRWVILCCLPIASCVATGWALGQADLSQPVPQFRDEAILRNIEVEIELGNTVEAGQRLAVLLQAHGTELMLDRNDRLVSVSRWADRLLAQHPAILAAYRSAAEPHVQRARQAVTAEPLHRHSDLHAVVRRFPRSASEDAILQAAAERALQFADPLAAFEFIEQIRNESPLADHLAAAANSSQLLATTTAGPLPFNAAWFATPKGITSSKSIPVSAGRMTFIAGASHVTAIDIEGQIRWTANDQSSDIGANHLFSRSGRGIVYEPAVATDVSGAPQVIVARQTAARSQRLVLRSHSAVNGAVLWSTENHDTLGATDFLGNPAIAGGLLYCVGLTQTTRGSQLSVHALDIGTGQPVWETTLGHVTTPPIIKGRRPPEAPFDPKPFWQQSAPAISGSALILTPGNGTIVCMDRFDGSVDWMIRYDRTPDPSPAQWQKWLRGGRDHRNLLPNHQLIRYRSIAYVHDGVVVVAPADAPGTIALNLETGDILWTVEVPEAGVLVGGHKGTIVLAGEQVIACDMLAGSERWRYHPADQRRITGPPVLRDGVLFVPMGAQLLALSADTGKPAAKPPELPPMRRILALEGIRRALRDAGLAEAFATPEN